MSSEARRDHEFVNVEERVSRRVARAFVLVAVAPFVVAATRSSFWQHKHSMAPVATALYLTVVLVLVVWRSRWAWALLVLFYGAGLVSWGFDSHRFSLWRVLALAVDVAAFGLLVSAPMRRRLRPTVVGG